jgi:hypothetical protein
VARSGLVARFVRELVREGQKANMVRKWRAVALGIALLTTAAVWPLVGEGRPRQGGRAALTKAFQDGNYKDAYEGFRKLALDPNDDRLQVGTDLGTAITCLQSLGRVDEIDHFREAVIAVHKNNWRLLEAVAQSYADQGHYGYIVAGKFQRGNKRGGGRPVRTMQRDRVRALQLMQQALARTKPETDRAALARFHLHFANLLVQTVHHELWRLQYLTDLTQLPDYEVYTWQGPDQRGAPVDADGNPVYYRVPKSYEAAKSDGERWRWMLAQAAEFDPAVRSEADLLFADFLREQFGVQTMAYLGIPFRDDDRQDEKAGTFALHTLGDGETIARLATGVKRFQLPDEFNWIKIYQRVAARGKNTWGEQARDALADVYEDRRQYERPAGAAGRRGVLRLAAGAGAAGWEPLPGGDQDLYQGDRPGRAGRARSQGRPRRHAVADHRPQGEGGPGRGQPPRLPGVQHPLGRSDR